MSEDTNYTNYMLEGPRDAPVLVLANSLGTSLSMWDAQIPALREGFRVLRYDKRGHGRTPPRPGPYAISDLGGDVLTLLDRLEVERFSFCGLSIGGMIGQWIASEVPSRVERLALLCTSPLLGPRETWEERIRVSRSEGVAALADSVLERWFTPAFRERDPEEVERIARMLRSTTAEGYAGCCAAIRDMDLRERLPEIEAPTLVVSAADDPATPPRGHGSLIHESVAGSRFEVVPKASHLANIEQPEAVTNLILQHLAPLTKEAR